MSVIGEAALSAFLKFLLGELMSSTSNFVADHKQVHKQLKEWELKLPCIQAVLNDAEEKQMKHEGVKKWLAELQDLAYDVDDILDEFAYEALRLKLQQSQAQAQASTSKVWKLIPTCCTSCFSPTSFIFNNQMISQIKDITDRLNHLTTLRSSLGLSEILSGDARSKGKKPRQQPTSVMDETVVYVGRQNEKREILELLKSCNAGGQHEVPVISIVGIGGMGKTTLAQLVYNDASLNELFPHKAWVCVSDDFDVLSITKAILRSLTFELSDQNDLDLLQVKLKEKLSGTNFLLVLDDIWNLSYNDWSILRSPFGAGTKVIVTTRFHGVSSNVDAMKSFSLDKLSDEDCLSIFTQYALRARDFNQHREFKEVGETIVRKCSGLPLAAKVIGRLLHTTNSIESWEKISKSEIWKLEESPEDSSGIIPALQLSYHYLPSHLKCCFAYCSILPKDYEFEENELILLWRAEGLLKQNGENQIKDFGNQCFQDLVSRSFFQKSSNDKSRFVMHDLINDLAQSITGEICSKSEDDKKPKFSDRTRHFSYVRGYYDKMKKFDTFDKVNSLRAFLPYSLKLHGGSFLTSSVLDDLLPRMKCLRLLSLNGYTITELPDFFENLKHLRYLDFSVTKIKCLPDSLCTLYHLETLILRRCVLLEKLPSKIGNLMELIYLDIEGANSIKSMPLEVGKLVNLHRLPNFICGKDNGHVIRELKILSNLSGDFCISGLENVKTQDARDAMLNEKSGITSLTLQWSENFDTRIKEEEEQVLNFLCPQKKLKQLTIENYGGTKFSTWIADSSLTNLSSLKLLNCKSCKSLPSIGRLPQLKVLAICGFHQLNEVGVEFYGENEPNAFALLENLQFQDMPNWEKWDPLEGDEAVLKFPHLRELCIRHCPKLLGRLPSRLHSLQNLKIEDCTRLVVSISGFPKLSKLSVEKCQELVDTDFAKATTLKTVSLSNISKLSIPPKGVMSKFTNLTYFEIGGWKEMASLSQYGFGLLGHHSICIRNCPQLVSLETEEMEEEKLQFGKIFGIESLVIENCERLNRLPNVLHTLQFITEMTITRCHSLVCFAEKNLPPTLKGLNIEYCENLKYLVDDSQIENINDTCFLERLSIVECPSLICLASRGDLANGLRKLYISNCSNITSLFSNAKLPLTLKELGIHCCSELECIAKDFHETTSLELIRIGRCGKIKFLPRGLDKLNHLLQIDIWDCSNLVPFEERGLPSTTNLRTFSITQCENFGVFPKCINNFTSLRMLKVRSCSVDICFPEEGFPTNLTSLVISKAPKISKSLVEYWGLDRLTALRKLSISGEGCSEVVSFPNKEMMLPASLTSISIENFENLEYMFSRGFHNLTSLRSLYINHCPNLTTLPEKDKFLSLENLNIRHCPRLKENCRREEGQEWSKIAHIPSVQIDGEYIIPRGLKRLELIF